MPTIAAAESAGASTEIPTAVKAAIAIPEAAVLESLAPFKPASIISASVIAPTVESRTPVEPMKPWARANKDAAYKVVWTVVTVRCASIRVISIVTIGAYRSGAYIGRTDSNAHNHSLCMRRSCGCKHANGQQSHIF